MSQETVFGTGKLPLDYMQTLLSHYGSHDPRLIAGPRVGEDVAVIDMGDRYMVVKTDPITFASDQIGWYAVHVNANDIATSGARPLWMLAALMLPQTKTTPALVESILGQLRDACDELDVVLVGGHTEVTWGLDRAIVTGVMIGEVAKDRLITTAGARTGDRVYLVKGMPIEATAIIAHERGDDLLARGYDAELIARAKGYLYDPGISVVGVARLGAECPGVHAMHDPTEGGVATALHELAVASGNGLLAYEERMPILPEGRQLCEAYGLDPLGAIASGALLVAAAPEGGQMLEDVYREAGVPCAHIADLVERERGIMLRSGQVVRPLPRFDADQITQIF